MRSVWVAAFALAVCGCSSGTPVGSGSTSTGPSATGSTGGESTGSTGTSGSTTGGTSSGSSTTGSTPGEVRFRVDDVYVPGLLDGGEIVHSGLDRFAQITVLLDAPDGGWSSIAPSSIDLDAGFASFDVPDGATFWVGTLTGVGGQLVRSSARVVDFGLVKPGRPSITQASPGTGYRLDLSGLNSSAIQTSLMLVSPGANLFATSTQVQFPDGGRPDLDGQSSVADLELPYGQVEANSLVDASQGDSLAILQLQDVNVGGAQATEVVTGALLSGFSTIDGTINELDAGLSSSPTVSFATTLDAASLPSFLNDLTLSGGQSGSLSVFTVDVVPNGSVHGELAGAALSLIEMVAPLDAGALSLAAANPFPASYLPIARLGTLAVVNDDLGDGGVLQFDESFMTAAPATEVTGSANSTFALALSPVRNVTIDGQSGASNLNGLGLSPQLAWDAPATGTPTGYEVNVEIILGGLIEPSAQLYLDASTHAIVIPSGILSTGRTYSFDVEAIQASGDLSATPFKPGFTRATADNFSGLYSP